MKSRSRSTPLVTLRTIILKEKLLWAILLVASILRFYNYQNRWALAYDQAWFAVIARHAIDTLQIPLLGPFASGGPFQTGGEWFWIVMAGILLNPFLVISPWIFITLLSIFQVYLLYILGKEFINKNFGYIVASLGAVSTSQTLQATNLTNQMTSSICASLFLLFVLKFMRTRKVQFLFLQGVAVGLSSAIHLQGVLLLPPLIISILLIRGIKMKGLILIVVGLILPWAPVLIVDLQNNFENTRNMLLYFVQPQSQIPYEALNRRWLTFILEYIPTSWARIAGGWSLIGYLTVIFAGIIFAALAFKRRTLAREWWIVFLSTGIVFIILRYIRTPLYENYITFIHPFVFLIIAFSIYKIISQFKVLGIFVFVLFVVGSVSTTVMDVKNSSNFTAAQTERLVEILKQKYPGEQFAVYDYKYGFTQKSLPLVYYLQTERLTNDNGRRIGLVIATPGAQLKFKDHRVMDGNVGEYQYFDLTSSSSSSLQQNDWAFVNPSRIYNSVQNWYKK